MNEPNGATVTIPKGVSAALWRWIDDIVARAYQVPPEAVEGIRAARKAAIQDDDAADGRFFDALLDAFLAFRLAIGEAADQNRAAGKETADAPTLELILAAVADGVEAENRGKPGPFGLPEEAL